MGTQVHCKSYHPEYFSMRDLNEDSNSSSWPLLYGDKTLTSGPYYNGYGPRAVTDPCLDYDKNALKQKMLEHEATFKKQVYELHRLYRIQRDMMEEIRRKELHKRQMSIEPSSSSSLLGSQMPSEDAGKWHISSFPLENSCYPRPSASGAEIVNSPLSCTKGNNPQTGRFSGSTSKDCEVLEARPSKVRKKLFDLQLPADEYIDTEETELLYENKVSNISSTVPNESNNKTASENLEKLLLNGGVGEKFNYHRDTSKSESCFRTVRLADLNEPFQFEEGSPPAAVDFLVNPANCGETKGSINISSKSRTEYLDLRKEIMHNAHNGNQSRSFNHISVGSNGNERHWLSGAYETVHRKNNCISAPQGGQQNQLPLLSQPAQVIPNEAHQSLPILSTGPGKYDLWRERMGHGMETLDRSRDNPKYNHFDSVMTSQVPNPYAFVNSSDLANSWSHSALSWAKPTSCLTEKQSSLHAYPSLSSSAALSKSSQPSAQSHGILGEKWHINGPARFTLGSSDLPIMNGIYHGSSSGSKEMLAHHPLASSSLPNCNGNDNASSGHSLNHGPQEVQVSFNYTKPAKEVNLNVVHTNTSSIEAVSQQDVEIIKEKGKLEDHLSALPWLRGKPASKSEIFNGTRDSNSQDFGFFRATPNQLLQESEPAKELDQKFDRKVIPILSDCDHGAKKEVGEAQGIKKILGFPIFEKPPTSGNETSLPVSTPIALQHSLSGEKVETARKIRSIDINLAYDEQITSEAPALEKAVDIKVAHIKTHIDLNFCVSEDEDPLATPLANNSASVKIVVDINLEAPVPDSEDDILRVEKHKQPDTSLQSPDFNSEEVPDEVARMAAEAIAMLSSSNHHIHMEEKTCHPSEDHLAEPLLWLAEIVSSYTDVHETNSGKEPNRADGLIIGNYSSDVDDFEVMTLQLQETKEEDYMPKPFLPEAQVIEESGANSVPTRPRKGQTRRGRQRRDFQRDILPGLASLSRHEVTEDLQTFGGLMRATGHPWNSGLTRRNGLRNGGARGRRRAVVNTVSNAVATPPSAPMVQQLNNIESGLEDISLTSWGKTTRRPRRQRCPAGNPPTVPLT